MKMLISTLCCRNFRSYLFTYTGHQEDKQDFYEVLPAGFIQYG